MAKIVAKTYGDALFEIALEEKKEELIYAEAKVFLEVIQKDDQLIRFMTHPKIVKEEKLKTGKAIFKQKFSKEFAGFLMVLLQKERFSEIEKTLEYFIGRMKAYKKIGIAYVVTARALSDEQKEKIQARLLETTDFEIFEMNYTVDETLLGGMVIRIDHRILDTSIKNKLKNLSKQLDALQVSTPYVQT